MVATVTTHGRRTTVWLQEWGYIRTSIPDAYYHVGNFCGFRLRRFQTLDEGKTNWLMLFMDVRLSQVYHSV